MIEKTKDYSKFNFMDCNRPLNNVNLEKIKKSIVLKNLLHMRPILVDSHFNVIDGQHRLQAARDLGLEVYYQIDSKAKVEDMITLNTNQRVWRLSDYINFYKKQKNENYTKLDSFLENNEINLSDYLYFAYSEKGGSREAHHEESKFSLFKEGKYIYDDAVSNKLKDFMRILKMASYQIKSMKPENCKFVETSRFKKAFLDFLSTPGVDVDRFLQRAEVKINWLSPRTTVNDYKMLLGQIYNFNNRKPLDFDSQVKESRFSSNIGSETGQLELQELV